MRCLITLFSVAAIFTFSTVNATTVTHDKAFVPDAILRVTEELATQGCLPSRSTVVVNGTSPGPELRLKEGVTYWIRVYNDITAQNLTMVSDSTPHSIRMLS